ncbi:MAG: tRNA (N(6)-L-threonylcarbamoyladenosine(37)-C(2))-methylthiotransferase MtaB [Candidatus Omnitrophota bacterium]
MRTIKFCTLGCKINQYDTQAIREQFECLGFREVKDSLLAEVCVVNTCTVTHRADRDSLYAIRRLNRENPNARIIVTGCMAQIDADKIKAISGVSLILKNQDKGRIASFVNNLTGNQQPSADNRQPATTNQSGITYFKNHSRAFLKIQDGCNYSCSYCKVRLVRGKSRSRSLSEIRQEAQNLIKNGYCEIVLCGVCLGSYGKDLSPKLSLVKLVKELEKIKGNFRIRLSSIEAGEITTQLIKILAGSQKLCRHLHIPVQSGDNQILRRMNRTYSRARYIKLIRRIQKDIPGISITLDVMVGFPGETEANFMNTVRLIKEISPLRIHIFPYSRRKNTPAYNFSELVSGKEIKLRTTFLKKLGQDSRNAYCQGFISKKHRVLIEGLVDGCFDLWQGHTGNYIKVRIKSSLELKNRIVKAKLKKVYSDFVLADLCRV